MTVYELIHKSLAREAAETEPDGRAMVARILQQMEQKENTRGTPEDKSGP